MGRIVGGVIGTALGYAAGYMLLLDPLGQMAHKLFWVAIRNGSSFDIDQVLRSETFWQIAIPAAVLGAVGVLVGGRIASAPSGDEDP